MSCGVKSGPTPRISSALSISPIYFQPNGIEKQPPSCRWLSARLYEVRCVFQKRGSSGDRSDGITRFTSDQFWCAFLRTRGLTYRIIQSDICFNGAEVIDLGVTANQVTLAWDAVPLQWSRGSEPRCDQLVAFNTGYYVGLQWSRGSEPRCDLCRCQPGRSIQLLQWSRGSGPRSDPISS